MFAVVTLAGCATAISVERRYAGEGSGQGASCSVQGLVHGHATLVVREGRFSFTPNDSTAVETGAIRPDGSVEVEQSRKTASGQMRVTQLQGALSEDRFLGTYSVPGCVMMFDLRRINPLTL